LNGNKAEQGVELLNCGFIVTLFNGWQTDYIVSITGSLVIVNYAYGSVDDL
jgi:hypothetical protein